MVLCTFLSSSSSDSRCFNFTFNHYLNRVYILQRIIILRIILIMFRLQKTQQNHTCKCYFLSFLFIWTDDWVLCCRNGQRLSKVQRMDFFFWIKIVVETRKFLVFYVQKKTDMGNSYWCTSLVKTDTSYCILIAST